ncbi:glucosamine-6-phosphate deaminase [Bosea sp. (in: a-proteobacteria)]|uniref:glucosamine-6-phosphate deaminase n=1 Tax=Bosea sp. (in: a-proteobacteria) TaxID=1871050 RepID=UPI003B3B2D8B
MIETVVVAGKAELGRLAAEWGAQAIREALARDGQASIIVATGASQFEMLEQLVRAEGIDWSKVTAFHLDEYVGLLESHPASFRRYLRERFLAPLGNRPVFVPVNGDGDAQAEAKKLGEAIAGRRICVCFAGIGENCHLAFNDPPADFDTDEPYLVVNLDEACRRQQLGEGWFPDLDSVPEQAISMSIRQILRSELIVLSVSDTRKAEAAKAALEGPVTNMAPASILQTHPRAVMFLDQPAAALLGRRF